VIALAALTLVGATVHVDPATFRAISRDRTVGRIAARTVSGSEVRLRFRKTVLSIVPGRPKKVDFLWAEAPAAAASNTGLAEDVESIDFRGTLPAAWCRAHGMNVEPSEQAEPFCSGRGIRLGYGGIPGKPQLMEVQITLRGNAGESDIKIGNSRIRVSGRQLYWEFL